MEREHGCGGVRRLCGGAARWHGRALEAPGERAQWHRDVEENWPVGISVGVDRVGVHEAAQVGGDEDEVKQPLVRHTQVLPLQRR